MNLEEIKRNCEAIESQLSKDTRASYLAEVSKWQLQQKILQTLYYKQRFDDNSAVFKRRGDCESACYGSVSDQELKDMANPLVSEHVIGRLQKCVKTCNLPAKDVETYVDNIDFLSLKKLDGCSKSCHSE